MITELAASPGRGRNFELGCVSMWQRLASTARYKFKMLETCILERDRTFEIEGADSWFAK